MKKGEKYDARKVTFTLMKTEMSNYNNLQVESSYKPKLNSIQVK